MAEKIKIALAGNPNCGKTTLFNALTGSNQFVGNWPGVTVEKKEGKLKKHEGVAVVDLPGIYSLSPYTLEEVVARNYLVSERPDAILNIIDATNLERNLYLTTQLVELGIPVVVIALNMMDLVEKNGDKIDVKELSRRLGCKIVEISALKNKGINEAAEAAVEAANNGKTIPMHTFSGPIEHAIAHIEEAALHNLPEEQQRWYAIKIFERDEKIINQLGISKTTVAHIEEDIANAEKELDDDAESIITNERYVYIAEILKTCYKKHKSGGLSVSDKIDKVVTNRWLALPIFAVIMFLVYFISMVTIGQYATDWANDGLFGDGYHLIGIGDKAFNDAEEKYGDADAIIEAFNEEYGDDEIADAIDLENEEFDEKAAKAALEDLYSRVPDDANITYVTEDEETLETKKHKDTKKSDLKEAIDNFLNTEYKSGYGAPSPEEYGVWVPGIPVLLERLLDKMNAADWVKGLILDGIVAGVGAVLGFVPQMPDRASGILIPTFGEETSRGLYMRDLGYYFVIGDHFDLSLTGDVYSYGSWAGKMTTRYKKRYAFDGSLNLNYSVDITGEPNSVDYKEPRNFGLTWSHTQDSKARPGTSFKASVNFSSPSNSTYNSKSISEAVQNQTSSSISYGKTFSFGSLSVNALHNQNSRDSSYSITLPNITFSVNRFYPFKRKVRAGKEKLYEQISFSYNTTFQNKIAFKVSEIHEPGFFNKLNNGMTHNFSIGLPQFTLFKYFNRLVR